MTHEERQFSQTTREIINDPDRARARAQAPVTAVYDAKAEAELAADHDAMRTALRESEERCKALAAEVERLRVEVSERLRLTTHPSRIANARADEREDCAMIADEEEAENTARRIRARGSQPAAVPTPAEDEARIDALMAKAATTNETRLRDAVAAKRVLRDGEGGCPRREAGAGGGGVDRSQRCAPRAWRLPMRRQRGLVTRTQRCDLVSARSLHTRQRGYYRQSIRWPRRPHHEAGAAVSATLGDALPEEMARVRDEVLPVYAAMPEGVFAATMMRRDLDRAARVFAEGDVVAMIAVYKSLQGWSL